MARKRGRGGARRRRASSASGTRTSTKVKQELIMAGAGYGYAVQHVTAVRDMVAKLPKVNAIGLDGTLAVALHFLSGATSGALAKWSDRLSTALAASTSIQLGRVKFDTEKMAQLGDGGEGYELSGELSGDEDYLRGDVDASLDS